MKLDAIVNFKLTGARLTAAIEAGLKEAFLLDVRPLASRLSPKKRGFNSRSIKFKVKGKTAEIWTESGYGGYLEVGTARMPARPYLRPSVERNKEVIAKAIARHL
jgi:HK97 gp10 family phage protein